MAAPRSMASVSCEAHVSRNPGHRPKRLLPGYPGAEYDLGHPCRSLRTCEAGEF